VVRAIAGSSIPVISAVGHEIDWSLADFAADLRAPTPSAAAELVSPLREDLLARLEYAADGIRSGIESRVERIRLMMQAFAPDSLELRFRRVEQPLLLRIDDAKEALIAGLRDRAVDARRRVAVLARNFAGRPARNPRARLLHCPKRRYRTIVRSARDVIPGGRLHIQPAGGGYYARAEVPDEKV
jgi:exodeoxyribonuclease VII large subunit